MSTVTLWFDPACYWSWRASRWLLDAAGQRGFTVAWRPFSLKVLYGKDINPDWADMLDNSHRGLRVASALAQVDATSELTGFWTAIGTAAHEQGQPMSRALIETAAETAGAKKYFAAFDDESYDEYIKEQTQYAIGSAGPDIGTPVIEFPGAARGVQGPVLAEVPPQQEAGELYDAISRLAAAPYFYEVTRGRA
ncbi:DsbA family protein [Allorhizocola rhizosphaerae]|uniref:mycothiol-dependent nitroreductase Rv2466c family protein n=1 Tax=Allorhizocola rhizosphaerae TaxID=1872709 RepID=UPI000E3D1A9B|nr:DsbA family protein [Allorhizocola rhizosphaerae]